MHFIFISEKERVIKYGLAFVKANFMFGKVRLGLFAIPFKYLLYIWNYTA